MSKKKLKCKTEEGSRRVKGSEQPDTKSATKGIPRDRNHRNDIIHENGHLPKPKQNCEKDSCALTEDIVTMGNIKNKTKQKYIKSGNIFPKRFHWLLFAITLTFRIWYVSRPSNWWVLHPDEIYQTMEGKRNYGLYTIF